MNISKFYRILLVCGALTSPLHAAIDDDYLSALTTSPFNQLSVGTLTYTQPGDEFPPLCR